MTQEQEGAAVLAELQAEIDAFEKDRAVQTERVDRERLLRNALRIVNEAAESEKRLTVRIAALDSALATLAKIDKQVDQLPDGVQGSRSVLAEASFGVRQAGIDDLGAFLEDVVVNSRAAITKQRDEATAALRRVEVKLADARAEAAKLSKK